MNSIFQNQTFHVTDEDDKIKYKLNTSKISIFSANAVSAKIVVELLNNFVPAEIIVFDKDQEKLDEHFSSLLYFKFIYPNLHLKLVTDIKETANSDVCITCFSHNQKKFEDIRVETLYQNILIYEKYVPEIVKYNPKTLFIVSTFPYSLLAYYCVKYSKFPDNRVLGLGTAAYSRIFRYMIANDLDICHSNIRGWIMGYFYIEDANNENLSVGHIPLWSTVSIGSVNLENLIDLSYEENFSQLSKSIFGKIREANLRFRGFTLSKQICAMVKTILNDSEVVFSISCNVKGYSGINFTAYIGLPCIMNRSGYNVNLRLNLLQNEKNELVKGAKRVWNTYKIINENFMNYKRSKSKVCIKDLASTLFS